MIRRAALAGVSEWAAHAAQITTGIVGVSYAFGWVLAARFYGALGVEPEDVGITVISLAVRAFLMGLAALMVVLTVRWLLDRSASLVTTNVVLSVTTQVLSVVVRLPLRRRSAVRVLTGMLVGFAVVFMTILPFRLADRFAEDVRAGTPVDFGLFGMSIIRVTPARMASADPGKPPPTTECVLRLGGNAGTSLFVVDEAVIRVSDQNVTMTNRC